MPPIDVPWPPRNFVAECTTMSAPHSIGRHRYGVANVLSTTSGTPIPWAIAATASRSSTVPGGVADRLGVEQPRARPGRSAPGIEVVRVDEVEVDRELAEHVLQLRDRAAVQRTRGDDVVARLQQREEGRRLRRQPARERDGAGTPLEARDALLEHRDRRVHDPRVGVPILLQIEVRGRARDVLEDVARGLEDRHGARAGVRIGPLARVQRTRVEPELPVGHRVSVWLPRASAATPGSGTRPCRPRDRRRGSSSPRTRGARPSSGGPRSPWRTRQSRTHRPSRARAR